jgi:hypothetical protein
MFSRALVVSGVITVVAVGILLGLFSKDSVNSRWLMPLAGLYAAFIAIIAMMRG